MKLKRNTEAKDKNAIAGGNMRIIEKKRKKQGKKDNISHYII